MACQRYFPGMFQTHREVDQQGLPGRRAPTWPKQKELESQRRAQRLEFLWVYGHDKEDPKALAEAILANPRVAARLKRRAAERARDDGRGDFHARRSGVVPVGGVQRILDARPTRRRRATIAPARFRAHRTPHRFAPASRLIRRAQVANKTVLAPALRISASNSRAYFSISPGLTNGRELSS